MPSQVLNINSEICFVHVYIISIKFKILLFAMVAPT